MKTDTRKTDLLPVGVLSTLPGWSDLDADEQRTIETETQQLGQAFDGLVRSRLAVGEHLTRIHVLLEPRRMFSQYCDYVGLQRSVAYNAITAYANATKTLPEPILRVAAARGVNMLGIHEHRPLGKYTDAVKRLPPPKTQETAKIVEWLEEVEILRRKQKQKAAAVEPDPDDLLKEAYRFVILKIDRVPPRRRRAWLGKLVGMGLAKIGVAQPQSFEPEAAPEDFIPVVGRPRLAA